MISFINKSEDYFHDYVIDHVPLQRKMAAVLLEAGTCKHLRCFVFLKDHKYKSIIKIFI